MMRVERLGLLRSAAGQRRLDVAGLDVRQDAVPQRVAQILRDPAPDSRKVPLETFPGVHGGSVGGALGQSPPKYPA